MRFSEYQMIADERNAEMLKAASDVNYAYLWANRVLDTVKESIWVEHGLPFTSDFIHKLAHANLERLDKFGDILHESHMKQTYPGTPEFDETIEDMNKAFDVVADVIFDVDAALNRFIDATAGTENNSMSLSAENLQMENTADRTKVLEAWKMWDSNPGKTSFDNWVKRLTESEADDE